MSKRFNVLVRCVFILVKGLQNVIVFARGYRIRRDFSQRLQNIVVLGSAFPNIISVGPQNIGFRYMVPKCNYFSEYPPEIQWFLKKNFNASACNPAEHPPKQCGQSFISFC